MLKSRIDQNRIVHAFTPSCVDDLRTSLEDPKMFFKHTRHRMMIFMDEMPDAARRILLAHTIANALSFSKIVIYNHETQLSVKVPIVDLIQNAKYHTTIVDYALTFKVKQKKRRTRSAKKKKKNPTEHLPLSATYSMATVLKFVGLDNTCLEKSKDAIYLDNVDVIMHIQTILGEERCAGLNLVFVFMVGLLLIKKQFNLTKKLMGFKMQKSNTKPTLQYIAAILEYPCQTMQFLHAMLLDDDFSKMFVRYATKFSTTLDVVVDKTITNMMSHDAHQLRDVVSTIFDIDTSKITGRLLLFTLVYRMCNTMKQLQFVSFIYTDMYTRRRYHPFKLIDTVNQTVLLDFK